MQRKGRVKDLAREIRNRRLPWVDAPAPGESLQGYLIRMAHILSYNDPSWITGLAGMNAVPSLPSGSQMEALADVLRLSPDAVREMTVHRFALRLNWVQPQNPGEMTLATFRRFGRRGMGFCARCLREKTHRVMHLLRPLTVCPEHGCLMINSCDACGASISWITLARGMCNCGQELLEMAEIPAEGLGRRAQEAIFRRLTEGGESQAPDPAWFLALDVLRRWFAHFPPGVLSLDGLAAGEDLQRNCRAAVPTAVDHIHYGLAWQVLEEGYPAFEEVAGRWVTAVRQGRRGCSFATPLRLILQARAGDRLAFLTAYFDRFAKQRRRSRAHKVIGIRRPSEGIVSLKQAARILKLRYREVACLVSRGKLKGHLRKMDISGLVSGAVNVDSLQEFLALRKEAASIRILARQSGVHPGVIEAFCLAGTLAAEAGPTVDGQAVFRVRPAVFREFVESVGIDGLRAMTPYDAGTLLRDEAAVTRDCDSAAELGTLPMQEAAAKLGVTLPVVRLLISKGFLSETDGNVAGIDVFLRTYLWTHQALAVVGVAEPVFRWMRHQGVVRPVFLHGRLALFAVKDVERLKPSCRWTVRRAADALNVEPKTLKRLIETGHLPVLYRGRLRGTLLLREDVLAAVRRK